MPDQTAVRPWDSTSANQISTNNSTTSTLGISGNFTGTGDDVSQYNAITVQIDSSHDSATDGMTFEFSSDNTNWDDAYQFTYTAANGARRFQFPVTAQYFRVNYTNGGTGQTHFRVQTIYHVHNQLTSIHRLGDNTHPDRSAQVVKSILMAQVSGAGDFTPIDSTSGGNLKVSVEESAAFATKDHDEANAAGNNPLVAGYEAIAHGTNPTAVAAADITKAYANRAGVPFVMGGHPNVITRGARNTAAQTDQEFITVGAGTKMVVTRVSVTVDNSCSVDVDFEVGFGASTVPTAAAGAGVEDMLVDFMGVPAGGGITVGDGSGILGVGGDGEELRYSNTVPTGGNCTICISYYTVPS